MIVKKETKLNWSLKSAFTHFEKEKIRKTKKVKFLKALDSAIAIQILNPSMTCTFFSHKTLL
jgi:hypothetical protein